MMVRVFKFGGALLKNAQGLNRMAGIVKKYSREPLVVVVSAIGKTTNTLENLLFKSIKGTEPLEKDFLDLKSYHLQVVKQLNKKVDDTLHQTLDNLFEALWVALNEHYHNEFFAYDKIVSFGERFASKIAHAVLFSMGIPVKEVTAGEIIKTDDHFTAATVLWKETEQRVKKIILPALNQNSVILTQGFTGSDLQGNTTTLGREGSDYTAAVFSGLLDTKEVVIWKDVPGLMNADPKLFKEAIKLNNISYREAIELAYYGAKVLHPKTIQPLQNRNIPLQIKSFFNPSLPPSIISSQKPNDDKILKIIAKENQTLLSIGSKHLDFIAENHLHEIFRAFKSCLVHVNLMQNSAVSFSVCFNTDSQKLYHLIAQLSERYYLRYNTGLTLLTLRHYTGQDIDKYTAGKKILLEQKNRTTAQFLF